MKGAKQKKGQGQVMPEVCTHVAISFFQNSSQTPNQHRKPLLSFSKEVCNLAAEMAQMFFKGVKSQF
jgi:hypothetical protein